VRHVGHLPNNFSGLKIIKCQVSDITLVYAGCTILLCCLGYGTELQTVTNHKPSPLVNRALTCNIL
jgi:hypothetical protein